MERDQSDKKNGTARKTPKFIVTHQAGYFKPLEELKNAKNQIVMYLQPTKKSNTKSTAETRLQCKGSMNFSSMYLQNMKIGETLIGHGEPPQTKELKAPKGKDGKPIPRPNPFYDNKGDGYLFLAESNLNTIEILIVPNGRYLIRGIAKQLEDGQLNEALRQIRETAKAV
jgi:hypothetical protein